MTKQTSDAYAENAAEFVKAARVANELREDLESASRRIAYVGARPPSSTCRECSPGASRSH